MAVRQLLLSPVVLLVALRGGSAVWTEEQCADGIANIATEARSCQEQAAGAGRDISGELVRGEPVCSEAMQTEVDAVFNECDGAWDWEDHKGALKTIAGHCNCGRGSAIAPAAATLVAVALRLCFS